MYAHGKSLEIFDNYKIPFHKNLNVQLFNWMYHHQFCQNFPPLYSICMYVLLYHNNIPLACEFNTVKLAL